MNPYKLNENRPNKNLIINSITEEEIYQAIHKVKKKGIA